MSSFYIISLLRGIIIGFYAPIWILFLFNCGYNLFFIGIIGTIFEIMKFLFEIPSGAIADKFGVRFNLIISCTCLSLTWLFFPFSSNILILIIILLTWTLSETMFSGTFESWLSYSVGEINFSKYMFNSTKIFILSIIVISPLSGFFYKINNYLPFILAGTISIILVLYLIICIKNDKLPTKKHKQQQYPILSIIKDATIVMINNRRAFNIIIASFFFAFVIDTIDRYWQPYFQYIGINEMFFGLITTFGGIILLLVLQLFSKFDSHFNKSPETYNALIIFVTMIFIALLILGRKLVSIISISLVTIVDDLMNTLISNILNQEMADKTSSMATIFSLNGASGAIGEILSGIIFGYIIAKTGYNITFIICVLVLLIPFTLYLKNLVENIKRRPNINP